MSKQKLIVNAKNFNGKRGTQLYCVSKDTLDFISKMKTDVRGQSFEQVAVVVKSNYATSTVVADNGKTYKVFDDFSADERG